MLDQLVMGYASQMSGQKAAFVTLNHIQTIDCNMRRAKAACGHPVRHGQRGRRCRLTLGLVTARSSIAHRGKPRLPGGSWEVTSLDVGLVALHQAQRYAVPL
ncbi:hypothetical protein E4184_07705 [Aeromonas media]|uniref:Uncharacterized protein n=1 Tax=Aeromonas media TaxID=651 RepID=A0A6M4Y7T9_AERME|nr:hypothetical protein E4184_07705 [Aeromonas media]